MELVKAAEQLRFGGLGKCFLPWVAGEATPQSDSSKDAIPTLHEFSTCLHEHPSN